MNKNIIEKALETLRFNEEKFDIEKACNILGFEYNDIEKSKEIKKLYTEKGLTPPKGKGIHTKKFHEMVSAILKEDKSKSYSDAAAIAMSKLGSKKAVKPVHQKDEK